MRIASSPCPVQPSDGGRCARRAAKRSLVSTQPGIIERRRHGANERRRRTIIYRCVQYEIVRSGRTVQVLRRGRTRSGPKGWKWQRDPGRTCVALSAARQWFDERPARVLAQGASSGDVLGSRRVEGLSTSRMATALTKPLARTIQHRWPIQTRSRFPRMPSDLTRAFTGAISQGDARDGSPTTSHAAVPCATGLPRYAPPQSEIWIRPGWRGPTSPMPIKLLMRPLSAFWP